MIDFRKVSPKLVAEYLNDARRINCIVTYNPRMRHIPREHGVELIEYYSFIHSACLSIKRNSFIDLTQKKNVLFVASIQEASMQMDITSKIMGFNTLSSQGEFSGEGEVVAILDTGVYPHMDFTVPENRIITFYDAINKRERVYDDNGHGTMVAGVSIGNGMRSGDRYVGVAPKAKIVVVKCMRSNGQGSSMDILRGMQWVYDNRKIYNIGVVCMSLGANSIGVTDPLAQGAETLNSSGICVVVAGGNSGGEGEIKSPGIAPNVITVGSYDDKRTEKKEDDERAYFSSRGPTVFGTKPNLLASGVNICTTSVCPRYPDCYKVYSGTSISTGIVAGSCVVIAQKLGTHSTKKIKEYLFQNCYPKYNDKNEEGNGLLYFDK